MAITTAMCNSFKAELLNGYHAFTTATPARTVSTADTFKIALYTSTSTNSSTTTTYNTTAEVASGGGYTTAGNTLTSPTVTTSTTVSYVDFADSSWTSATFTAAGALIYNFTQGGASGRAVCSLDFGGDKTVSSGTFTIVFPANTSSTAIIRLS